MECHPKKNKECVYKHTRVRFTLKPTHAPLAETGEEKKKKGKDPSHRKKTEWPFTPCDLRETHSGSALV